MTSTPARQTPPATGRDRLDDWVREVVRWHFDPETGCPFWLEFAKRVDWDPREEIAWDQPHEGNLFEHLYARRAFQRAGAA